MLVYLFLAYLVPFSATINLKEEVFKWKHIDFVWPNDTMKQTWMKNGKYIPYNILPCGIAQWKDKMFITLPRYKTGITATLTYIPLNTTSQSPSLIPYPNWELNSLPEGDTIPDTSLISVFRVKVDACDRLWVMDMGISDVRGENRWMRSPTFFVFDLNTDTLIRRYTLKRTDITDLSYFENLIVDVTPDKCNDASTYFPDIGSYAIVVYSWAQNDSWRFEHNYFHIDPMWGDLYVGGIYYEFADGVMGIVLGEIHDDGNRRLIFHPLVSTKEFEMSTGVLKNRSLSRTLGAKKLLKLLGEKGNLTQSTGSVIDLRTNVMFETQISRDGFACWKTTKPLNPDTFALIAHDNERLVYTNDLMIDHKRNLWILSNQLLRYIAAKINPDNYNYRIFKVPIDEAIRNTVCE